jgi:hypothetical protein
MTWLVGILGLAALVFLHELGHFVVARLVGMKPRAFYIDFPLALGWRQRASPTIRASPSSSATSRSGRAIPPVVGRNARRRQTTRQAQVQPPGRRRDHARLGCAHLRCRARPATNRLTGGSRVASRAGAARAARGVRGACRGEGLVAGEHLPDRFGEAAGEVNLGVFGAALFPETMLKRSDSPFPINGHSLGLHGAAPHQRCSDKQSLMLVGAWTRWCRRRARGPVVSTSFQR